MKELLAHSPSFMYNMLHNIPKRNKWKTLDTHLCVSGHSQVSWVKVGVDVKHVANLISCHSNVTNWLLTSTN